MTRDEQAARLRGLADLTRRHEAARFVESDAEALEAGADALRRTCGTCDNWKPAVKHHLCERFGRFTDPDDGCIKGYAPKEDSRG